MNVITITDKSVGKNRNRLEIDKIVTLIKLRLPQIRENYARLRYHQRVHFDKSEKALDKSV